MLGIYDDQRKLRHAKRYAVLGETIRNALREYASEVESGAFPTMEHAVAMDARTLSELRAAEPHVLDEIVLADFGS
jgi:3-methyl-2-oxobutanoate hydroxymethyltransferase